jgi:hypothetical protein
MRSTTVKCLVVVARRKKFYTGATVTENMFPEGEFDRLIQSGHLNQVEEVDQEEQPEFEPDPIKEEWPISPTKVEAPLEDSVKAGLVQPAPESQEEPEESGSDKGPTMGDLRKALKDRGITYPANAKKEDLIKLLAQG